MAPAVVVVIMVAPFAAFRSLSNFANHSFVSEGRTRSEAKNKPMPNASASVNILIKLMPPDVSCCRKRKNPETATEPGTKRRIPEMAQMIAGVCENRA